MAAYQGTYYAVPFQLLDDAGAPVADITAWQLSADIRDNKTDTAELLSLTTANGGLAVTNGPQARFELRITAVQTALLPLGRMVFDVLRTDASPGPVYLFGGSFPVKQPVTR